MDLCPFGKFNNLVIILYALIFEKVINKFSIKNTEYTMDLICVFVYSVFNFLLISYLYYMKIVI
jgi:hypothetical protein